MTWWDGMERRTQFVVTMIATLLAVLGALGTAYGLGAKTGPEVRDVRTLPARMEVVEVNVDTLKTTTRYLMHVDSVRPVVWDSVSAIAADVRETRCFVKALALKRDPLVDCSALLNERQP